MREHNAGVCKHSLFVAIVRKKIKNYTLLCVITNILLMLQDLDNI